ncbi:MAG: TetR/AcrR family transcriptional regulator [Spirochaetes bacterium]|nr:TetR/AcrR family transcriptional regulator [Spirochaetota bacterium]
MQEKKEKIFKAALNLFNTQGFDATTTAQIAKQAHVATGTLFHYFKTKKELINQLYLYCRDSLVDAVAVEISDDQDFYLLIRKIWRQFINWGINNKDLYLFFRQFNSSPYISRVTREKGQNRLKFLEILIERGKESRFLKDVDIDLLVNSAMGIIISQIEYLLIQPEKVYNQKTLDDAFRLFIDSIKKIG